MRTANCFEVLVRRVSDIRKTQGCFTNSFAPRSGALPL